MLRSEECDKCHTDCFDYNYDSPASVANWLEEKLKEPTVVMKDPIYRIPDDEL